MLAYSLLVEKLGISGRMISGSKSGYRERKPNNLAIFNANICVEKTKIWYGDIDLTESIDDLKMIAIQTGETLYVLYEMDARFEHEEDPQIQNAAVVILPDGTVNLHEWLRDKYQL
jgi:hypothetical protein